MAKSVQELQVWQRAEALAREVFSITERPPFRSHQRLAEQLNDAAGSILANIAEGFAQTSDKGFARFLTIARGSCNEVRSHLAMATIRGCVAQDARHSVDRAADEINRMLTGLERYLRRSDRKVRF